MKIAFLTTQSLQGSTVIGRVLPLAEELSKENQVFVLGHGKGEKSAWISVGANPFTKTPSGKHRQRGFALALTMLTNAITAALTLVRLQPDVLIIVKSFPENVLAAQLATFFTRPKKIILDVDDFELTANQLTSWTQRAAIHWAERVGARLADHIVAATPFLTDHFEQLTQGKKRVTMILTGINTELARTDSGDLARGAGINNVKNSQRDSEPESRGGKANTLVYAGSLSLSSGHRIDLLPEILELVRQAIPDAHLEIYGDGDDSEVLKHKFAEKNLAGAVTWHGRFTGVPATGIILDPVDGSITNRAKSSFRVAFAAAYGLPVVTSDIGIRPYLLPQALHARCFAKPADAADYTAKIVGFIRSPLSDEEQQAMRKHAEGYSWLRLSREYEKIIMT